MPHKSIAYVHEEVEGHWVWSEYQPYEHNVPQLSVERFQLQLEYLICCIPKSRHLYGDHTDAFEEWKKQL